MKKNFKIVIALVLLFIVLVISSNLNTKVPSLSTKFVIKPGDSFKTITDNLVNAKVIKDKLFFTSYAYFSGDYRLLKPGEYLFDKEYNIKEVLNILKTNLGISITIPEGFNIFQVENELIKKGIITKKGELVNYKISNLKDDFEKYPFLKNVNSDNNLEGFLYPNTYYFLKNTNIKEVVTMFLDNFKAEVYLKTQGEVGSDDFYTKLILASLLEKEIYHKEDMPKALSVIQNRIDKKMLLQIDATLCYIKMKNNYLANREADCGSLTNVDKKLDSLYNTYMNKGLISAPICNVNLETFQKTLEKVATDYLYYITDPKTKNTIFAKTLEEHNQNINKYLK
jgi:UPF0755 protein